MGQILSHGVYLPNEGERNCYAGLASNWQILNTAVGNIAEKAPLVHTHTVSQITDFPAYGNAAGTICEGNDSRLSDARTPVAHTHGKADITDLFNSDFIPSANNAYDLGSSANQWKNLYANNYYYNGVAWGLDQINVWTNRNILESWGFTIRENSIADSTPPSFDVGRSLIEVWGSDSRYWGGFGYRWGANGVSELVISNSNWNGNTQGYWEYTIGVNKAFNSLYFKPPNGLADLGTSTNKWKTLNGINPGALSLPGEYSSSVTEYITDKTGGNNAYTAPADGWVGIQASSVTLDSANFIFMGRTSDGSTYFAQNTSSSVTAYWSNQYHGCILLPVTGGTTYGIRCKCDTVDARFYKANGNVS